MATGPILLVGSQISNLALCQQISPIARRPLQRGHASPLSKPTLLFAQLVSFCSPWPIWPCLAIIGAHPSAHGPVRRCDVVGCTHSASEGKDVIHARAA